MFMKKLISVIDDQAQLIEEYKQKICSLQEQCEKQQQIIRDLNVNLCDIGSESVERR